MLARKHIRVSDLHGIQRLASDATLGITNLVEAMHHTILRTPGILGQSPSGRTGGITGIVYRSVRGVTRLVGGSLDILLAQFGRLVREEHTTPEREAALAALNGVLGDYLAASGNALALPMRLYANGVPLEISRDALAAAVPEPGRHLVVLVHGLCRNHLQWTRDGHDHGAALARDLGCTPVYLQYNSGRHISENGREYADLMEALLREWPHPIERISMLGHSMGGLVIRSACHYGALADQTWVKRLDRVVFLGTPHFGSPLERAGTRADFLIEASPYTAPFARLGKVRSAGVRDLGHGYLCDEDWQAAPGVARARHTPLPLPVGVRCYAMAASQQRRPGAAGARVRGDGLVPVHSALGRSRDAARDLGLPDAQRWIGYGMGHFDLLDRAEAYQRIRGWIEDGRAGP